MNNLVYHNNYHRSNHHTVPLSLYPESAKDPIASYKYPFIGTFYNNYYDIDSNYIGQSNSYEWWSTYTTTNATSSLWEKSLTTYTTVCSNSASWSEYSKVYTTLNTASGYWQSTFLTLCTNVDYWNAVFNVYTEYYNKVQEDTHQKTFKNFSIYPSDPTDIVLNLSAGQVSTYITNRNSNFSGFVGQKKGGIYHLILITDARDNPDLNVTFNSDYFAFPNFENLYTYTSGLYLRKFHFLCDGNILHGKSNLYEAPISAISLLTILDNIPIMLIGIGGEVQII